MKHCIAAALSVAFAAAPAVAQTQAWIRQVGTSGEDRVWAAAMDGSGGMYVSGYTYGNLGGPNAGANDAWLARYDRAGNQTWIRQFGTSSNDLTVAAASDGFGGVYVTGQTKGNLGGPNAGSGDVILARYDGAGNQTWIRQFGSSANDVSGAAASDGAGGVYVGGFTWGSLGGPYAGSADAWLARYDSAGNQTWIRQLGTSGGEQTNAAEPDGLGGVYVCGYTYGSLGAANAGDADAWLAHYDGAGNQTWIRQLGTSSVDIAYSVAQDGAGGVYVSGDTWGGSLGGPNVGAFDPWLARYDSAGNQTWIRQFGTSTQDSASALAPDWSGGVYITGTTYGSLGGPNASIPNRADVWLARYDGAGNQTWICQFGTIVDDAAVPAVPDGAGGVFLGGDTKGSFSGSNAGGYDVWVARYVVPCATSGSSYCIAGTTSNGCVPSISGTGTPSASAASGFTVAISDVEGAQSGLIFYGVTGPVANAWGTGTSVMCVKLPLERTPVQNSGGSFGACDGALSVDWNLYLASNPLALGAPFVGGEIVFAQAWFRDPPSPKGTNLSNGLQFTVCP